MLRLFSQHKIRECISLEGAWNLTVGDKEYKAAVPGIWENIPEIAAYRGKAVYTKEFTLDKAGNVLLNFGGVSHTADVYVDSAFVGHHYDAFTGFSFPVKNLAAGVHTITVQVDNSFSELSTLHIPNDYYSYGGITRPADVEIVPDSYISAMDFYSTKNDDGTFDANVLVHISALKNVSERKLKVTIAGKTAEALISAMGENETADIDLCLKNCNVQPWNPMDAHLYQITATLCEGDKALDDLTDRVGFRTVEVKGEDILINGSKVTIKGFNRHEDFGSQGCAVGINSMMEDIQLALDMGANSIRTCHYPNDQRFIDLCDEMGILVWEECHSRAIPGEIMRKPLFLEQIDTSATEMVRQYYNHPCIYTWGLLNECESETEFGRGIYSHVIDLIHSLDKTRPVTFASCRFFKDICLDLVDIASFNIYPQWYHNEDTYEYANRLLSWMDENGAKNKPIIISEIGAGAVYGYHDPLYKSKWSEERQSEIIDNQLTAMESISRISGTYIWQFADVRVAEEFALHRPKSQNNKGVVDMYRRPKLAYVTVKKHYGKK